MFEDAVGSISKTFLCFKNILKSEDTLFANLANKKDFVNLTDIPKALEINNYRELDGSLVIDLSREFFYDHEYLVENKIKLNKISGTLFIICDNEKMELNLDIFEDLRELDSLFLYGKGIKSIKLENLETSLKNLYIVNTSIEVMPRFKMDMDSGADVVIVNNERLLNYNFSVNEEGHYKNAKESVVTLVNNPKVVEFPETHLNDFSYSSISLINFADPSAFNSDSAFCFVSELLVCYHDSYGCKLNLVIPSDFEEKLSNEENSLFTGYEEFSGYQGYCYETV